MPISSPPLEISIVYHRAGIDAEEYDTVGIAGRLRVESSIAIKCPTVLGHLAGSKIVQQVLSITSPTSTISRQFLSPTHNPEIAEAIERTFEVMLPLTDTTPGHIGREIALNPRKAADWILKPCREGGGHNIFGRDISEFLRAMEIKKWDQLIIMKKIEPTITQSGVLLTRAWGNVFNTSHSAVESVGEGENDCEGLDEGLVQAEVVSELGIFGTCVWRTRRSIGHTEKDNEASRADILLNETSGWSFKCKPVGVNEMSVVKGYGCFGSPFLVDEI